MRHKEAAQWDLYSQGRLTAAVAAPELGNAEMKRQGKGHDRAPPHPFATAAFHTEIWKDQEERHQDWTPTQLKAMFLTRAGWKNVSGAAPKGPAERPAEQVLRNRAAA